MRPGSRLKGTAGGRRNGPRGLFAGAFEAMLLGSADHVLILGPDLTVLAAGATFRAEAMPGEEPVGQSFLSLLDSGSRAKAEAFLTSAGAPPGTVELSYRAGPRSVRLATYTFCRFELPAGPCYVAVGRDQEDALRLVERLVQLNAQAEQAVRDQARQALTDPLTGLGNRRWLAERLTALWAAVSRQGGLAWVFVADLDHFKRINDTRGHQAGDDALRAAATAFRKAVRTEDLVARYGGEEFVMAGACRSRSELEVIAARVLKELRDSTVETHGGPIRVTASLGAVLVRPRADCPPEEALRVADAAVYRAKHAGRDRAEVEPGVLGEPAGKS